MRHRLQGWHRQDKGATAIEYALIGAGIALAVSAAIFLLGDKLAEMLAPITDLI